jgi:NAD-dependent DNA ligase
VEGGNRVSFPDAKQRLLELRVILRAANHAYYIMDNPTMTDYEYDMLLRELQHLEETTDWEVPAYSLTQTVGFVCCGTPFSYSVRDCASRVWTPGLPSQS